MNLRRRATFYSFSPYNIIYRSEGEVTDVLCWSFCKPPVTDVFSHTYNNPWYQRHVICHSGFAIIRDIKQLSVVANGRETNAGSPDSMPVQAWRCKTLLLGRNSRWRKFISQFLSPKKEVVLPWFPCYRTGWRSNNLLSGISLYSYVKGLSGDHVTGYRVSSKF